MPPLSPVFRRNTRLGLHHGPGSFVNLSDQPRRESVLRGFLSELSCTACTACNLRIPCGYFNWASASSFYESVVVAARLEVILIIPLFHDCLRPEHTADADKKDDQYTDDPVRGSNRPAVHAVPQDHAEYAKAEIGRDGAGTVDGLLSLPAVSQPRLGSKEGMPNVVVRFL